MSKQSKKSDADASEISIEPIEKEIEVSTPEELPPIGYTLVVKSPFRKFKKGDHIADRREIAAIMNCSESSMVIKRATNSR